MLMLNVNEYHEGTEWINLVHIKYIWFLYNNSY